ncbi:MAG: hypothetical protein L6R41_000688 [Letrouitia leprolyta]|nr:MAG: hypothetical protein L6R41_000688 [Letrouitia leprolyta]
MCCRTTSTDTCRDDGLCDSTWDGNVWRDFCTDPTWQAPNCVKLCLKTQGTDGDGNTGGTVRVTQCPNGSYCCGAGAGAQNCCNNGAGVWVDKNGQTTNFKPTSTAASRSTAAASSSTNTRRKGTSAATTIAGGSVTPRTTSISATPTTVPGAGAASQTASGPSAAVTKTVTKNSTNNTGAIAGGVVAGVLGGAIIIGAVIWALRRRQNRQMEEKRIWDATAMRKPPPLYGEMEGSITRHEMPAPVGHEMPTGAPIPKQNGSVELP